MATILPTIFPNAFSWMKIFVFDKNSSCNGLSQAPPWQQLRIGLDDGLEPNKHQV